MIGDYINCFQIFCILMASRLVDTLNRLHCMHEYTSHASSFWYSTLFVIIVFMQIADEPNMRFRQQQSGYITFPPSHLWSDEIVINWTELVFQEESWIFWAFHLKFRKAWPWATLQSWVFLHLLMSHYIVGSSTERFAQIDVISNSVRSQVWLLWGMEVILYQTGWTMAPSKNGYVH